MAMKMARMESAPRAVLELNAALNRRDVAGMMLLVSDNCTFEHFAPAPDGAIYVGKEAIAQFWQDFLRESPQARVEIEEIFGLGLRCVTLWRCEWVDAAGQKSHIRGADIFRVENGLICEHRSYVKR